MLFPIMKIILSNHCKSLIGAIDRSFGYHIQRRKSGFYGVRQSKGFVPPDGHWNFIVICAKLAQNGVYLSDIEIDWIELNGALYEAGHFMAYRQVRKNGIEAVKTTYNARDIINLKTTFGL